MRKALVWSVIPLMATGATFLASGVATAADSADRVTKSYETTLTGEAEVAPGDPDGRGKYFQTTSGDQLCYTLRVVRIRPATAAHIHEAPPGVAGPVIVTLLPPDREGVAECITAVPDSADTTLTLSKSELAGIKATASDYYVNVHNYQYPGGAVRGQLRVNDGD